MSAMAKPDIPACVFRSQTALMALKSFDPAQSPADDFVYLCAKFCDALIDSPASDELNRRAVSYKQLTGPESAFEDARGTLARLCGDETPPLKQAKEAPSGRPLRRSAFEGAIRALTSRWGEETAAFEPAREAPSGWCSVEIPRLTLAGLRAFHGERYLDPHAIPNSEEEGERVPLLPVEAVNPRALIRLWCVGPETIYDVEWTRRNLHTVFAIMQSALKSGMVFHPPEVNDALARFRDATWAVWRRADREHLFGSYLLLTCQDAVNAGLDHCRNLLGTLAELESPARAAAAAAEDICHFLASSGSAEPSVTELHHPAGRDGPATIRDGFPASPGSAEPNVTESDRSAGLDSPGTIGEVTVSFVEKACVLRAEDVASFVMTEDETRLFVPLIRLIAAQAATGLASWELIAGTIRQESPEWAERQHPQAAKGLSLLNSRMAAWGTPPDGAAWIGSKRGKNGGRFLNRSVGWLADEKNDLIRAFARKRSSVSGPSIDPHTVAESTADAEHELPARPHRTASHLCDERKDESG
ncbi:MAG: hypothetical protein NTY19_48550 [Planctomycetota bacterium]|nr:hypothetical protein [Planctomycetota bacterium]